MLWLAFVDTFDGVEMAAGASASLIAAVAAEAVRSRRFAHYESPRLSFSGVGAIARSTITDTLRLFLALGRDVTGVQPIRGAFRAVPLGGSKEPDNSAERAIATLRLSIAPNTYVVDFDTGEKLVLVHQLLPVPKDGVRGHLERLL